MLNDLRRLWELKLIQSGALAVGAEINPEAQKGAFVSNVRVKSEEKEGEEAGDAPERPAKRVKTEEAPEGTNAQKQAQGVVPAKVEAVKDEENIDDDIDELLENQVDPDDLALALIEKKFKSKDRYRFMFKSGIIKLNGQEYVFEKGTGDFRW